MQMVLLLLIFLNKNILKWEKFSKDIGSIIIIDDYSNSKLK